jgi:hypothetical protein
VWHYRPCQAPSADAVIAEQAQRIAELQKERDTAANWMLDMIRGSLLAYPNLGGDIEVMREVERIVNEATAELQKDKALIDDIMADMRIVAGIGGCDIDATTAAALAAKGSASSDYEHARRDEWRVQFRKAAYAAMLQTVKEHGE